MSDENSHRYDKSVRNAAAVNRKAVEISVEIGKEKTRYFEKLAFGCGAALVAIASFIGARPGVHVHPAWLLRLSLVSLALGTSTAMYWNWRYHAYLLAHWQREAPALGSRDFSTKTRVCARRTIHRDCRNGRRPSPTSVIS